MPSVSRRAFLALATVLFATAAGGFPEAVFIPEIGPELPIHAGDVESAEVSPDQYGAGWQVQLTFSPRLRAAFAAMTEANVGKVVRLYVDGELVFEPIVREPIRGGQMIVAPLTQALAERLAALAKSRE